MQGCSAGIKLKMSESGQSLVVIEILEEHNHIVDKVDVHVCILILLHVIKCRMFINTYLSNED